MEKPCEPGCMLCAYLKNLPDRAKEVGFESAHDFALRKIAEEEANRKNSQHLQEYRDAQRESAGHGQVA